MSLAESIIRLSPAISEALIVKTGNCSIIDEAAKDGIEPSVDHAKRESVTLSSAVLVGTAAHMHDHPNELDFVIAFYGKNSTLLAPIDNERIVVCNCESDRAYDVAKAVQSTLKSPREV